MHLCIAGSIRAMPEKEKLPAMPVDIYYNDGSDTNRNFATLRLKAHLLPETLKHEYHAVSGSRCFSSGWDDNAINTNLFF